MRLHILGRNAGCPGAGGACVGYLVEGGGRRLLLECGPGTVGRLQAVCDLDDLDAVLLSHLHMDYFFDLFPLAYGLMMRCQTTEPERHLKRVPLHLPAGGIGVLARVGAALDHVAWHFPPVDGAAPAHGAFRGLLADEPNFVIALLPPTEDALTGVVEVAGLRVTSCPVKHGPPAAALRLEGGGRSLAYSGDTADCPQLVDLARGADVFLCEATKTAVDLGAYDAHLSPTEAGRIAAAAGVGRLVLTHLWPWADEEQVCAEAAAVFPGLVQVAREGNVIAVEPPVGGPASAGSNDRHG